MGPLQKIPPKPQAPRPKPNWMERNRSTEAVAAARPLPRYHPSSYHTEAPQRPAQEVTEALQWDSEAPSADHQTTGQKMHQQWMEQLPYLLIKPLMLLKP